MKFLIDEIFGDAKCDVPRKKSIEWLETWSPREWGSLKLKLEQLPEVAGDAGPYREN